MGGVTLVLSGGGAKAAAHIGAWRALVEAGLAPERVVAASMGAVVGAALCAGAEPDALLARLAAVGPRGIVKSRLAPLKGLFAPALLQPAPFRRAVAELVVVARFADLHLPLTVVATDLDRGAAVRFGAEGEDAPLVDALVASCALPVYLPPVILGGRRLGDGGLLGVVPLAAVGSGAEQVVAVDVGPGFDAADDAPGTEPLPALLRAHDDATGILMAALTASEVARWRADPSRPPLAHVRPRLERAATFRVDRVRAYADAGYEAARGALAALAGPR
jgi:NTE family protein